MKIACITDDGRTIHDRFGRAPYYAVLTVEDGEIVAQELRDKLGHQHFGQGESGAPATRGTDAASHDKHLQMAQAIEDCEVLLCRGMGYGAYQSMERVGITPVVTDVEEIEEAAMAYAQGHLKDHPEKLH